MKRILAIGLAIMFAFSALAQKDVTTFLGIPVDGTKEAMIQKLKAKGFEERDIDNVLFGEFNGYDVGIVIKTVKNNVYRVMVADAKPTSLDIVVSRFNTLCEQFENNERYISVKDYRIPKDEDVAYEMHVHRKEYQACFFQKPTRDTLEDIINEVRSRLSGTYTEEQLDDPNEEVHTTLQLITNLMITDMAAKKPVCFMIYEYNGKYSIAICYDNEYNKANGEDL